MTDQYVEYKPPADGVAPSRELILSVLDIDFETGKMTWRSRSGNARFTTRYNGTDAFTQLDSKGYHQGKILGRAHLAHRIIFAAYHGYYPLLIDHINRDKRDNRIVNLRASTPSANQSNRRIASSNTSGFVGVKFCQGRWQANIASNGKRYHLGTFREKQDAVNARNEAAVMMGNTNGN